MLHEVSTMLGVGTTAQNVGLAYAAGREVSFIIEAHHHQLGVRSFVILIKLYRRHALN